MKQDLFVTRASVIAVRGALLSLAMLPAAVCAADPETAELTQPTSQVEVGVGYVNKDSFKFGEYNGLENKGAYAIGNFDLRGGGAYDSSDPSRFRIRGTDLGLETRSLSAEYGQQGKFRLNLGYDEFRRNYSDSYQTLWNGAGSSDLTLPAAYPAAAARSAAAGLANWNNIQSPYATAACATTGGVPTAACRGPGYVIPALMQNTDVDTKRQKIDGGLSFIFSPTLSFNVAARHEDKDGTKLTGAAFGGFKGALLPEPISSSTDTFEAALRYIEGKARLNIGYSGSLYRNDIKGWFADTPFTNSTVAGAGVLNNRIEMNGAPSNQMHQFTLSGGYAFSPTMKLAVSGSESRMTQNQAFAYESGPGWNVPVSSPNAKEVQDKFLTKLTMRPITDLFVTAAYKYDYRDSKTPVNTYLIAQYDGIALPGSTAINNNVNNVPINRKQQQFMVDADYSPGRSQVIAAGYQWEQIDRTADAALNPVSHEVQTPWLSEKTTEHTFKIDYRNTMSENVSAQLGYARSQRRASNYEEPEVNPTTASANIGLFSELPGYRQFYLADRNRDKVRGALNFQASDALSLQASVDYLNDKYPSQYGVQESTGWAFNFDATHAVSDNLVLNLFVTYEDMEARQNSSAMAVERTTTIGVVAQPHTSCTPYPNNPTTYIPVDYYTDPCRLWSETQADKVTTVGAGFKWGGLMGGRLALNGNVVYSRAVTPISFTGGTYFSNGLTGAAGLNTFIAAQGMPDSISEMYDFRLGAQYTLTRSAALRFNYLYRHLKSNDALYDNFTNSALGVLATQAFIGPGLTSPNYNVQVVGVSYIYSFK